jgi:predicted GH43/DUF377 family glycosyl hydrolase
MKWIKKGLILSPGKYNWMLTHASIPTLDNIAKDQYRIYFYGRDKQNKSSIGYFNINIQNPENIINLTDKPVLEPGLVGTFDDFGVMPSWIINHDSVKYLYYTGWTKGVTVPHYFYVGLAISQDKGLSFSRYSSAPILERNEYDPFLIASPCVLIENGIWRMWYTSSSKRELIDNEFKPFYQIKYAESKDGIHWSRKGIVCINLSGKHEFGVSRPCVLKEEKLYRMWYSRYIGLEYSIGYAESLDGIVWIRKDDEAGITKSSEGWDSQMIEYSYVLDDNGKKYMFYNGNEYGKTGLGYAILA